LLQDQRAVAQIARLPFDNPSIPPPAEILRDELIFRFEVNGLLIKAHIVKITRRWTSYGRHDGKLKYGGFKDRFGSASGLDTSANGSK
jgi:hypothetical protein